MRMLRAWRVEVSIWPVPTEVSQPIPFLEDRMHNTYNADHATRFFNVLSMVELLMKQHRSQFRGRTTPVQFFWETSIRSDRSRQWPEAERGLNGIAQFTHERARRFQQPGDRSGAQDQPYNTRTDEQKVTQRRRRTVRARHQPPDNR